MRYGLVLSALAVVLAACGSSAASSSSSAKPAAASCGPAGAKTLASSSSARVYVVGKSVSACSVHGRKTYRLGQRTTCIASARIAPVVVAGDLVAFGREECGVDTGSTEVVVRRLTDGVRLRIAAATTSPGVESFQSVGSLVLKRDGAVAWIGAGSSIIRHAHKIEVYKADNNGPVKLLDSGLAVAPGSLRLHGSSLSWQHGGSTRTASLS